MAKEASFNPSKMKDSSEINDLEVNKKPTLNTQTTAGFAQ